MARKALILKTENLKKKLTKALSQNKKMPFQTRVYNRCKLCNRGHGYMRKFEICRICFRQLASEGLIPGLQKSSW
ncbi:30S ribosomal protein S14 type Z [Candidatus Peregrinibacteria bacterium RIFOXYB2_FULL_32_7]|nr:MAG: 30S ribosomal protein S14 type Z [Candidatus Peregrinibacteria bacterium RIFOXYB2_FULL_32_7]